MQIRVAFQFRRLSTVSLCPPVSDSVDGHSRLPAHLVGQQVSSPCISGAEGPFNPEPIEDSGHLLSY